MTWVQISQGWKSGRRHPCQLCLTRTIGGWGYLLPILGCRMCKAELAEMPAAYINRGEQFGPLRRHGCCRGQPVQQSRDLPCLWRAKLWPDGGVRSDASTSGARSSSLPPRLRFRDGTAHNLRRLAQPSHGRVDAQRPVAWSDKPSRQSPPSRLRPGCNRLAGCAATNTAR